MGRKASTVSKIQALLADGTPRSSRDIARALDWGLGATSQALRRAWEADVVLRTANPIHVTEKHPDEGSGAASHLRSYHLFCVSTGGKEATVSGHRFVSFSKEHLDSRGGGGRSKARAIREFLSSNGDKAFYSTEIAGALKGAGVKIGDVMSCVRRLEARGMVYVRGQGTDERQTPFRMGYLITWLDPSKSKDEAIEEAGERTNAALGGKTFEEREAEPSPREERGQKGPIGGPRGVGDVGNRFFLYVPPELTRADAFPFQPGIPLSLEVKQDCLIIRPDEQERSRVPFLPPNSGACWFKGTCRTAGSRREG